MHVRMTLKPIFGLMLLALTLVACSGTSGGVDVGLRPPPTAVPTQPQVVVAVVPTPVPAKPASTPTLQSITVNTIPGTPTAAAPQPTLQPIVVNTIPEDGNTFEDELPFQTSANDPAVGPASGDGIANVTFQFFGPDGQAVFSHVESNVVYCAFGGGDGGQPCASWAFSEHKNQWPNGKPAQSGPHRLVVTVRDVHGRITRQQRRMVLQLKSG